MVITSLLSLLQMLINFPKMQMHVELFVNSNFLQLMMKKIEKKKKLKQKLPNKLPRIKKQLLVLKKIILHNLKFQKRVIRKDLMQAIRPLKNLKWKNLSKILLIFKTPPSISPN